MAKKQIVYVCAKCGGQSGKWSGRCPDCHEWNTLTEEVLEAESKRRLVATPHRPLLVELQALVVSCAFGTPRRRVTGVDLGRTSMVLAVLEKHAGLDRASQDVFVNVAGGVRIREPASDLAVALAVAGSLLGARRPARCAVLGELGLDGETRPAGQTERRLAEAERLGFTQVVVPSRTNASGTRTLRQVPVKTIAGAIALFEGR